MTSDAKESLVALVVVSLLVALIFLPPLILEDIQLPRWLPLACLGLSLALLARNILRRRRPPR